jgi:hypothetical protein
MEPSDGTYDDYFTQSDNDLCPMTIELFDENMVASSDFIRLIGSKKILY